MSKHEIKKYILKVCQASRHASKITRTLSNIHRNKIITSIIDELRVQKNIIFKKNELDIKNALKHKMTEAMVDRLLINEKRLSSMINGLKKIKSIPDTLFQKINKSVQPSGITVEQMRVPIGVIGMIYESRPNVTIDAAGLSIKSGNSIILRGGSEAINTNMALSRIINQSIRNCDMPTSMVQLIQTIDRTAVSELLKQDNFVDVIIPRGGKALIKKYLASRKSLL